MTEAAVQSDTKPLVLPGLTGLLRGAADAAQLFVHEARPAVAGKITRHGKVDRKLADLEQHSVHG